MFEGDEPQVSLLWFEYFLKKILYELKHFKKNLKFETGHSLFH